MTELILSPDAALAQAHAALLKDLRKLKALVFSPDTYVMQILDRLDVTAGRMADHFRLEEKGGYMDTIRKRSPHLGHAINKLLGEHEQLLTDARQLVEDAQGRTQIDEVFRDRLLCFIEAVRDHEVRENVLVEDAYNQDTAAED